MDNIEEITVTGGGLRLFYSTCIGVGPVAARLTAIGELPSFFHGAWRFVRRKFAALFCHRDSY